jgi:hypothetical protein
VNEIHTLLDILVGMSALAVAFVVGKDNIKKQTIKDLKDLVVTLTLKIEVLEDTVGKCRDANTKLKDTVDGYTELVREGYLFGRGGSRGRNNSAAAKIAKNRES